MDNPKPELPLKARITLFFLSAVTDATSRHDGTVNRRFFNTVESLARLRVGPCSKPRKGVKTSDITVDSSRNLWFRLFIPCENEQEQLPVIVFFHGGGFVYLSPDARAYDEVCRRFAREIPAVVVSVNYRLAPEHRYPAQFDDGFDVLKFLDDHGRDFLPENADVSRCFLAGDSAGGNLAHHLAVRWAANVSAFAQLKVVGVAAIQPFFGGEERTKAEIDLAGVDKIVKTKRSDFMWKALMPDEDRDHEVINVSGPNAVDISKLDEFPAVMVVVAGFDSLKDWQIRYYEWLKDSGKNATLIEFPNMIHAFYIFPQLPDSTLLVSHLKTFVHKHLN